MGGRAPNPEDPGSNKRIILPTEHYPCPSIPAEAGTLAATGSPAFRGDDGWGSKRPDI